MNTRQFFTTLSFSFFVTFAFAQTTYFVSSNGTGSGASWEAATNKLDRVLSKAKSGDQIWIAAGTYLPSAKSNRETAFIIPSGVQVFGGFAGNESKIDQRVLKLNATVLSGNIGTEDKNDNSYTVVVFENATAATILDGVTIQDGYADGAGETGAQVRAGGAIYNNGKNGRSNPTLRNCIFSNNFAKDGGAVYNNGRGGDASPSFENCVFASNSSDLDGGAVYNDGRSHGNASASFTQCVFEENKGNYGGAVSNYAMEGIASPSYTECIFSDNKAYVKGGAIFYLSNEQLDKAAFTTVQFNNNSSLDHTSDEIYLYQVFAKQMASN